MRTGNYIILFLLILSCSSFREYPEIAAETEKEVQRFRYVNLSAIFEYMIMNDEDAGKVKKLKEEILAKINSLNESVENDQIQMETTSDKMRQYKSELAEIKKDEEHFKKKILDQIDRAIENIAKRTDIDFIFNIGEGAVYAKKEYDITADVLREIIKEKERSSPTSR